MRSSFAISHNSYTWFCRPNWAPVKYQRISARRWFCWQRYTALSIRSFTCSDQTSSSAHSRCSSPHLLLWHRLQIQITLLQGLVCRVWNYQHVTHEIIACLRSLCQAQLRMWQLLHIINEIRWSHSYPCSKQSIRNNLFKTRRPQVSSSVNMWSVKRYAYRCDDLVEKLNRKTGLSQSNLRVRPHLVSDHLPNPYNLNLQ